MSAYKNENRKKDVMIAEVMGWTDLSISPMGHAAGRAPCPKVMAGIGEYREVPFFHVDEPCSPQGESAKALLLHWLAEDDERWREFIRALRPGILDNNDYGKWMMLATPVQVAEAAFKALGLEGK